MSLPIPPLWLGVAFGSLVILILASHALGKHRLTAILLASSFFSAAVAIVLFLLDLRPEMQFFTLSAAFLLSLFICDKYLVTTLGKPAWPAIWAAELYVVLTWLATLALIYMLVPDPLLMTALCWLTGLFITHLKHGLRPLGQMFFAGLPWLVAAITAISFWDVLVEFAWTPTLLVLLIPALAFLTIRSLVWYRSRFLEVVPDQLRMASRVVLWQLAAFTAFLALCPIGKQGLIGFPLAGLGLALFVESIMCWYLGSSTAAQLCHASATLAIALQIFLLAKGLLADEQLAGLLALICTASLMRLLEHLRAQILDSLRPAIALAWEALIYFPLAALALAILPEMMSVLNVPRLAWLVILFGAATCLTTYRGLSLLRRGKMFK